MVESESPSEASKEAFSGETLLNKSGIRLSYYEVTGIDIGTFAAFDSMYGARIKHP